MNIHGLKLGGLRVAQRHVGLCRMCGHPLIGRITRQLLWYLMRHSLWYPGLDTHGVQVSRLLFPSRHTRRRLHLRMLPIHRHQHPIQGIDVGLGRGNDDVGIGTLSVDDAAILFQTHRHLALRVRAAGNVVHRI